MAKCLIQRRKMVRHGKININGVAHDGSGDMIEWRTEACGTPLFSSDGEKVCNSCLKGWTHEHNFMLDTADNHKLIQEAKK